MVVVCIYSAITNSCQLCRPTPLL